MLCQVVARLKAGALAIEKCCFADAPRSTWTWMGSCAASYSTSDGSWGSPSLPSPMHCCPHPHCCSALLPSPTPSHPPLSLPIAPWDTVLLPGNNITTCAVAHVVMLFFAVTLALALTPSRGLSFEPGQAELEPPLMAQLGFFPSQSP